MPHDHESLAKPLVSLNFDKLLGMRQVASVSSWSTDGASCDSAGGAANAQAEMSRLLSKIGVEAIENVAPFSRAKMGRLLSKIGTEN